MDYVASEVATIRIKGENNQKVIFNAEIATDIMPLPGFLAFRVKKNNEKYIRFISLSAIEEMVIDKDEYLSVSKEWLAPAPWIKAIIEER